MVRRAWRPQFYLKYFVGLVLHKSSLRMPSEAAKKRQAQKKKQAQARGQKKSSSAAATGASSSAVAGEGSSDCGGATAVASGLQSLKLSERSCTG